MCQKNKKEPKLFCKDEEMAVSCLSFLSHQNHEMVPTEEAIAELKEQLRSDLKSLQDKSNNCKQGQETYNNAIQHFNGQRSQDWQL